MSEPRRFRSAFSSRRSLRVLCRGSTSPASYLLLPDGRLYRSPDAPWRRRSHRCPARARPAASAAILAGQPRRVCAAGGRRPARRDPRGVLVRRRRHAPARAAARRRTALRFSCSRRRCSSPARFALLWWRYSLGDFVGVPALATDVAGFAPFILLVTLSYPVALVVVMQTPAARRYFAVRGQDPWHARLALRWAAIAHHRGARAMGAAMALLGVAHVLFIVWCAPAHSGRQVQAHVHLFAAILSFACARRCSSRACASPKCGRPRLP